MVIMYLCLDYIPSSILTWKAMTTLTLTFRTKPPYNNTRIIDAAQWKEG